MNMRKFYDTTLISSLQLHTVNCYQKRYSTHLNTAVLTFMHHFFLNYEVVLRFITLFYKVKKRRELLLCIWQKNLMQEMLFPGKSYQLKCQIMSEFYMTN